MITMRVIHLLDVAWVFVTAVFLFVLFAWAYFYLPPDEVKVRGNSDNISYSITIRMTPRCLPSWARSTNEPVVAMFAKSFERSSNVCDAYQVGGMVRIPQEFGLKRIFFSLRESRGIVGVSLLSRATHTPPCDRYVDGIIIICHPPNIKLDDPLLFFVNG